MIFKMEHAADIEQYRRESISIDTVKREVKNKINAFFKGAFTLKVEEAKEDAATLSAHCTEHYAELIKEDGPLKQAYNDVHALETSLPTFFEEGENIVKGFCTKLDDAKDHGVVETLQQEWDEKKLALWTTRKSHQKSLVTLRTAIRAQERAAAPKKAKKDVVLQLAEGSAGAAASGLVDTLHFIRTTYLVQHESVNTTGDFAEFPKCVYLVSAKDKLPSVAGMPCVKALVKWTQSELKDKVVRIAHRLTKVDG